MESDEEQFVAAAVELVNEALVRRGMVRAELAARLGLSPSAITQRLSGRRNLSLRCVAEMLHELGYEPELRLCDRDAGGDWPIGRRE